jgi:hypothetical protein
VHLGELNVGRLPAASVFEQFHNTAHCFPLWQQLQSICCASVDKITVRQLNRNDWQLYKTVRLESLVKHPAYFSPSRNETAFTEADWKERLNNPNAATFGLFENGRIIGITGIFIEGNVAKAKTAQLASS